MSKIAFAVSFVVSTLLLFGTPVQINAAESTSLKSEILRLALDWEHVKFQIEDRDEQEKQMHLSRNERQILHNGITMLPSR
ncbi:MAG: hypothetical protein ACXWJW_16335 [Xanthobacteraceae bacterium]